MYILYFINYSLIDIRYYNTFLLAEVSLSSDASMAAATVQSSSKNSASFLSYRNYCCFLCTRSGLNDLFDFDTSILQEIRESSSMSDEHLIPQRRNNESYHQLARSLHSPSTTQKMSYKLVISGGIIWFIQYMIYSMLFPFYAIKSINFNHNNIDLNLNVDINNTNIYRVGIIIALTPFISLIFIPIFQKFTLIYKIGLSRCVIIGLIFQGLLCILFGLIPTIINNTKPIKSTSKEYTFFISNIIIRIFSSILSVLIELSIISIITQITPRKVLSRQQCMPLFCMIGLMTGPFLSGYLYCISFKNNNSYQITFIIIGCLILISTIFVYYFTPSNINNIPKTTNISSYISAFFDMNVIYSSIITIYSLICITFLLPILPFFLNNVNCDRFNFKHSSGFQHIVGCYMAFGVSFIIMSYVAINLTYRNCGSLRTMLCGLIGISIGLIFISRTTYIFSTVDKQDTLHRITTGLIILGISSAFTITPYLLYLRNALFRKYQNQTTNVSLNIFRIITSFGIMIGPIIGCLTYSINHNIETPLFILAIISMFLSVFGFILFKCLRWEWMRYESDKGLNSTPLIYSNSIRAVNDNNKKSISPEPLYEIRYIPILQDDKQFCCLCNNIMCFCSFGAMYDKRQEHVQELQAALKNKHNKRKKGKNGRRDRKRRKKTRRSFDEDPTTNPHKESDDVAGKIVTIRKKSSKGFNKTSFGQAIGDHEYTGMYGNDGKTVTKDGVPAPTPEERRTSLILAHSWNTVLNTDSKTFLLPPAVPGTDSNNTPTTDGSNSPSQLSREKSRKLQREDIHTPRGDTIKAISNSQARNSQNASQSNNNNDDNNNNNNNDKNNNEENNDENENEIEMSLSTRDRRNTPDLAEEHKMINGSSGNNSLNDLLSGDDKARKSHSKIQTNFRYPLDDRLSDSEYRDNTAGPPNGSGGRISASPSPFVPSTPKFNASYYRIANQRQQIQKLNNNMDNNNNNNNNNNVQSHSLSKTLKMIEPSVQSSGTEAPSQTFLLLSDDDFASRRDDDDIYNEVPEIQEDSFPVQ